MTRAELIALGFPKEWINERIRAMTRAELVTQTCSDCGVVIETHADAIWRLQLHRCRCEACAEKVTNTGYTEWESHYVQ